MKWFRKHLGQFHRALHGMFSTYFEPVPPIPPQFQKNILGHSFNKKPIPFYQLGNGSTPVLLVFGLHGNEVGTVKLAHHLLRHLATHLEAFAGVTLYVVPCLNPDGYSEAVKHPNYWGGGRIGRFNGNKVDLNRNFASKSFQKDSNWCFGENYRERSPVYCGESGGSEPETQALMQFILNNKIENCFIFHNCGQDVMPNRHPRAEAMAKQFSKFTGFKYVTQEDWTALNQTGTPKEWCEENNIAFVEIEGSTRWGSDWKRQKEGILAALAMLRSP